MALYNLIKDISILSKTHNLVYCSIKGYPRPLDCLMLSTPTRLVRKKPTTLIVYLCMLFSVFTIEFFFVFPCK